jgi:hypothetical protein
VLSFLFFFNSLLPLLIKYHSPSTHLSAFHYGHCLSSSGDDGDLCWMSHGEFKRRIVCSHRLLWKPYLTEQWQPMDAIFCLRGRMILSYIPYSMAKKGYIKWYGPMTCLKLVLPPPSLARFDIVCASHLFEQVVMFSKTTNTRILSCLFWPAPPYSDWGGHLLSPNREMSMVGCKAPCDFPTHANTNFCLFSFLPCSIQSRVLYLWRAVWSDLVHKGRAWTSGIFKRRHSLLN